MNILIFGGNGFLGSTAVEDILKKRRESLNIILVNRKHWPWSTKDDIKPYVKCIYCDRKKNLTHNKELINATDKTYFDFVIDFSAYSKEALAASVSLLEGNVGLYIFISSDSVYEVCDIKHSVHSKESDSVRPNDTEKQNELKKHDSYGHKKLECEEVLKENHKQSGLNYLILRLADIIGPKDSTDRWWTYQLWLELNEKLDIPVLLPSELKNKHLSFVYSSDVSKLISSIVFGELDTKVIHNQIYNLACQEVITLDNFLIEMNTCLGRTKKKTGLVFTDSEDVPWIFPSVSRGPINISKALSCLRWEPKPISEAINETVEFYKQIQSGSSYRNEKEEIIDTLIEDLSNLFKGIDIKTDLQRILY